MIHVTARLLRPELLSQTRADAAPYVVRLGIPEGVVVWYIVLKKLLLKFLLLESVDCAMGWDTIGRLV